MLVAGCAAPGTDYEALPFYREDRTIPGVVKVDVPLLLMTVDTWPTVETGDTQRQPLPGPGGELDRTHGDAVRAAADEGDGAGTVLVEEEEEVEGVERDYYVRFPWPFGLWQRSGGRRSWTLTAFALGEGFGRNGGPAGRAVSSEPGVSEDVITAFADGPETGGLFSIPFVFSDTLVDHRDQRDVPGEDLDHDLHLWPFFVYGGGTGDEHDYFALAPFGGTTQELIGKEKITWVGFPYPLFAKVEDRSYDSYHVLFPFINWVDGPRNSGFRVWPFYGHYERRGLRGDPIYDRTYLMWPFLTWSTSGMNEVASTETFFFFPFYGRIRGPWTGAVTVLWPFFKYQEDRTFNQGETWELRAPFPFLIVGGGTDPDRFRFDVWPLFGVKERKNFHRHFALWPIWRYESLELRDREFSGQWLLPLFWRTKWEEKATGATQHKVRVFPLLHYRGYRDGSMELAALSPWFFDDQGFERTLGPLFRLYRYTRNAAGGTEHQALFGLFSYRDLPEQPEVDRPAYTRLSLLFGMFQYYELGRQRGLRLLWFPKAITWGDDA